MSCLLIRFSRFPPPPMALPPALHPHISTFYAFLQSGPSLVIGVGGSVCDVYALQLSSRIPKFCSLNSVWNSFSDEPRGFHLGHSLHANRFYIPRAVPSLELTARVCVCGPCSWICCCGCRFRSSSHSFKSAAGVTEMWLGDLQSPPELLPNKQLLLLLISRELLAA